MSPRQQRFWWAVAALLALGAASTLVLSAFEKNLVFFLTPSQVQAGQAPASRGFRVGGLVESGSVQRGEAQTVRFVVTDLAHRTEVRYQGALPDLFKEGKGVVVQGRLGADGVVVAQEVLAKHDENYMPPEAAYALEQAAKAAQQGKQP